MTIAARLDALFAAIGRLEAVIQQAGELPPLHKSRLSVRLSDMHRELNELAEMTLELIDGNKGL